MKFYKDFVLLTNLLYTHCTLEEKMAVYVQHKPASVVPFLVELVEQVKKLELAAVGSAAQIQGLEQQNDEEIRKLTARVEQLEEATKYECDHD